MKIKYTFIILFLNLMMISCQSKSEQTDLNILQEPKSVFTNKTYPLRYHNYTDEVHRRIVLQGTQIQEKWQPFKDHKLDYMDVYCNKERIIGFKGYLVETDAENNRDKVYQDLVRRISADKSYHQIELKNDDPNVVTHEWESKELILGLKYERINKSIALIAVYKSELPHFFDKVFYDEFLNVTKLRNSDSEIHLKELKVQPSANDKNFYKEKFKDLKKEYGKK
ncbi:hypothetical protein [Chryseobacterium jejuense]|uniref:GLPGLI family protein n=1 Tax=Chryseobacterium jejuense TaxID=445960 RepID=A0A2X2X402_CHRJE|nr:hypothetical protein [Chryseobacterium jejuense]SDI19614.1 hypothetical protein SAMN05421542_0389 [Chryseobacterium jejuense]SQB46657.1 Uncharacterised protein [Chryseobacterium jejuense]